MPFHEKEKVEKVQKMRKCVLLLEKTSEKRMDKWTFVGLQESKVGSFCES